MLSTLWAEVLFLEIVKPGSSAVLHTERYTCQCDGELSSCALA